MLNRIRKKVSLYFKEKRIHKKNIRKIKLTIKEIVQTQTLTQSSLISTLPLISNEKITTDNLEVIVSLTTYNKRIHDVHLVLESIAQQTVRPNKIILWLDEDEFSLDNIPNIVKRYLTRGLDIKFCPNYKSYKKIIPTLKLFPDSHIITIDDDIIYPYDMIEQLVKDHDQYPNFIIGHRAHKVSVDKGHLQPYKFWERNTNDSTGSHNIFLTGCAGIFYPVNSLYKDVAKDDIFMQLCPHADDIWLKTMAFLNDTPHKKVNDIRDFDHRFTLLSQSQDIGLNKYNVDSSNNDKQIRYVLEYYKMKNFNKK